MALTSAGPSVGWQLKIDRTALQRVSLALLLGVGASCGRTPSRAPQVDLSRSSITVDRQVIASDGSDRVLITVHLVDSRGDPLSGHRVMLSSSGSENAFL